MGEIIGFLTAGAFVYLGLKIKFGFGDLTYYTLVLGCLIVGWLISHFKGV